MTAYQVLATTRCDGATRTIRKIDMIEAVDGQQRQASNVRDDISEVCGLTMVVVEVGEVKVASERRVEWVSGFVSGTRDCRPSERRSNLRAPVRRLKKAQNCQRRLSSNVP